jgi:hypothetical protein
VLLILTRAVLFAAMSSSEPDSLRLALVVPTAIRAGATVPITLRVENRDSKPTHLYLRGRTIAFDVIVTAADGDSVWRRLEGALIPAIIQAKTLAPGETLELRARWNQRTNAGKAIVPGRYTMRGVLLTDAAPLETPSVELRIRK